MTLPAPKIERLDAAGVNACIRKCFGNGTGDQYSVLFEVRNGTAWRANRSIDAVVMPLWPSLGMHLTGIEVKVSRGDWLREFKSPEKASEVFDFFDKWYLVAPSDVAKLEEIPEPWGWYVPERGTLRQVKPAAVNTNVKPLSRHFLAAIMRQNSRKELAPLNKAVSDALAEQKRVHDADIDRRVLEKLGMMKQDAEEWAKLKDLLKDKPSGYVYQPEVIACLKTLLKVGVTKSYGGLGALLNLVNTTRDQLLEIADEIGFEPEAKKQRRRA